MTQSVSPFVDEPLLRLAPAAAEAVRVSLSKLFDPIAISLVETTIGRGEDDTLAPGLHIGFHIDAWAEARLLVMVENRDAARIGDVLLNRAASSATPDERAFEAITEMANIAASSFLSRIASLGRIRLLPSPPEVHREPAHLGLDSENTSCLMVARYELHLAGGPARFRLVTIPEKRLMDALRVKVLKISSSAA